MHKTIKLLSIKKVLLVITTAVILSMSYLMLSIYQYSNISSNLQADTAIILGAAIWGDQLSPVFTERINHGISLYQSGRAKTLIFTGGVGQGKTMAESEVAKNYALNHNIPSSAIYTETQSYLTIENLIYAKDIMRKKGLQSALIVSDPLHMRRAMTMAEDTGITSYPSPTPTSRYKSIKAKLSLLFSETLYYSSYLFHRGVQAISNNLND